MKRWLLKLAVFLLLGAVVNVAVAWGITIWGPNGANWAASVRAATADPGSVVMAQLYSGPGSSRVTARARRWVMGMEYLKDRGELLPHWAQDLRLPYEDEPIILFSDARGWPVLSLRSVLTLDYVYDQQLAVWVLEVHAVLEGFPLPRQRRTQGGQNLRALPLRPIWPGFAINTVFYAAILSLLWSSPFVVRRFIRVKRGLCINCGYDLRGNFVSGCPECGWRREDVR